jgi:hypothetical protein
MPESLPPEGVSAFPTGSELLVQPPDLAIAGCRTFIKVSVLYPAAAAPQAAGIALRCRELVCTPSEMFTALDGKLDLIDHIATVATTAHTHHDWKTLTVSPGNVRSTIHKVFGLARAMDFHMDQRGIETVISSYHDTYKKHPRGGGALAHISLIKERLAIPAGEWGWPTPNYQ